MWTQIVRATNQFSANSHSVRVLKSRQILCRSLSTSSSSSSNPSSHSSSSIATSVASKSPANPLPQFSEPLVSAHDYVPPPPSKGRSTPILFTMQVLFLGYGVGKFEVEMLHGSPQLSLELNTGEVSRPPSQIASSRFDLSAHRNMSDSSLRSSWASSRESQQQLTQRSEPDPIFSDKMQFGGREMPANSPRASPSSSPISDSFAVPSMSSKSATPSSDNQSIQRSPGAMPPNNRIILHSSVIMYQNVVFCWSPKTFDDVTVESLSFLRTLTPRPEMILLGTGSEISHQLPPDVAQFLAELGIGCELMGSGNAIGTYNILTDEGRTVLAAMVMKPEPPVKVVKESRSQQMRRKLGYWNTD